MCLHSSSPLTHDFDVSARKPFHPSGAVKLVVVVSSLLEKDEEKREDYVEDVIDLYEEMREEYYAGLEDRRLLTYEKAMSKSMKINWNTSPPVCPPKGGLGVQHIRDFPLADVVNNIDWSPFFQTWELRGRYPNRGYPKIFNDEKVGEEAKKLYADPRVPTNCLLAFPGAPLLSAVESRSESSGLCSLWLQAC